MTSHAAFILAIAAAVSSTIIAAPQDAPVPKFDVVSVKPCKNQDSAGGGRDAGRGGAGASPGRLSLPCRTVESLIRTAYLQFASGKPDPDGITMRRLNQPIQGSPTWNSSERYTIDATTESPQPRELMNGPMLQMILQERFQLKIHRETREVPTYALMVTKGGARLKPLVAGECISVDPDHRPPPPTPGQPLSRICGLFLPSSSGDGTDMYGATLAHLSNQLSVVLDRDIVDQTGISGSFDIHFDPPDRRDSSDPPLREMDPATSDWLRRSLQRVGLKIESSKGSAEFLVIDRIERPSAN